MVPCAVSGCKKRSGSRLDSAGQCNTYIKVWRKMCQVWTTRFCAQQKKTVNNNKGNKQRQMANDNATLLPFITMSIQGYKLNPTAVRERAKSVTGCREIGEHVGDSVISFLVGLDQPGNASALARINIFYVSGTIGTSRVLVRVYSIACCFVLRFQTFMKDNCISLSHQ